MTFTYFASIRLEARLTGNGECKPDKVDEPDAIAYFKSGNYHKVEDSEKKHEALGRKKNTVLLKVAPVTRY